MFAPDHQAVANELLRVCRPGGTIGLANFTPEGGVGEFFGVFAPYLPTPPEGALPPVLWGDEEHVRELFGDDASLELTRSWLVERSGGGPREYCDLPGDLRARCPAYSGEPDRVAALDRDFLDFATRMNRGEADAHPSTTTIPACGGPEALERLLLGSVGGGDPRSRARPWHRPAWSCPRAAGSRRHRGGGGA